MDATARQRRLVELAHGTPAAGDGLCAAWVEAVFSRFGFGVPAGHASELFCRWCGCSDVAELKVGMIVAVGEHPFTPDGLRFGHVGLYVGDGAVMDCAEARVRRVPLDLWLSNYGVMVGPRWGWLAGIALDRA